MILKEPKQTIGQGYQSSLLTSYVGDDPVWHGDGDDDEDVGCEEQQAGEERQLVHVGTQVRLVTRMESIWQSQTGVVNSFEASLSSHFIKL